MLPPPHGCHGRWPAAPDPAHLAEEQDYGAQEGDQLVRPKHPQAVVRDDRRRQCTVVVGGGEVATTAEDRCRCRGHSCIAQLAATTRGAAARGAVALGVLDYTGEYWKALTMNGWNNIL